METCTAGSSGLGKRTDGNIGTAPQADSTTAAACPSCGVFSTWRKGCVTTSPRDIPYGEDRITLRWNKTRWRCREDYCNRSSFTETIAQVPARARTTRTTRRLRTQIGAAIGDAARLVAEVAASHGVSRPTAHRAFAAHAAQLLTEPEPTRVLGIDETRRGKPRWEHCTDTGRWTRVDPWDIRASTCVPGLAWAQSMDGGVSVIMAARHHAYDVLAVLGYSAIHTVLPMPN